MRPKTSNTEPRTPLRDKLPPRVRVLGGQITPLDLYGAVHLIMEMVRCRESGYLCVANVHTATLAARDLNFRQVLDQATAVVADGMPVVWRVRMSGYPQAGRVYGADLIEATCTAGIQREVRHGFLGGLDGVGEALVQRLRDRYPSLAIAGTWNPGTIRQGEVSPACLLEAINKSNCDLLWVGLGAPKQEFWMAQHRRYLHVPVLVGVGQAFDILAGRTTRPPVWMSNNGLEWLYRVTHEPRRLWKRYAVYNCLFLLYSVMELCGYKPHQEL